MQSFIDLRLTVLFFAALALPAQAGTLYFRSGADSFWANLVNWYVAASPGNYTPANRLPDASDDVILQAGPDGQTGTYQVNSMLLQGVNVMNGNYYSQTIQMLGGSGFTHSTITVQGNGQMQVFAGGFACTLSAATLIIQPGSALFLTNGAFLLIQGETFISDQGEVILTDGSVINGVPGTNTLDILPGAQLLSSGTAIVEAIGAPGPFTINNNGTVVCNNGLLELSPSLLVSTNGTARFQTVAASARIFLDPPSVGPGVTFIFTGPGTNSLSGATVQGTMQVGAVDSGTGLFQPGNLVANSAAQILGPGSIHVLASNSVASTLTVSNSLFNATGINIDSGALFNIVGGPQFVSNIVNNAGTIVWTNTFGSPITLGGAATFNNLAGGTFIELDDEAGILQAPEAITSVFNNFGTFRIMSGTNTVQLGVYSMWFNNNGLLDVQSGNVNLNNGASSGRFNLAAGTTLVFTGPTNVLNPGASFTGAGTAQVSDILLVNGNVTVPNLTLAGGPTIEGPGQLTVTGTMLWNQGTLQGGGTLNIAAGATLSIAGSPTLNQGTLNNSGTVNWSSPIYFVAEGGAVINNLSGALFNIQASTGFEIGPATFNNFGTVQKSAGSGSTTFNLNFNNAGLFQVLTGSVSFPYLFQQTAGSSVVSSGATFYASGGFALLGGVLGGDGTVIGPLTNSGVVRPGMSPGILTLSAGNTYTQSVAGVLDIEIGGLAPGTQYSQLAAAGCPVSLGGSLDVRLVNAFQATPGQQFTILTCASRTGVFPVLNGAYLGNGLALVPVYSSTNVVLVASNVTVFQPPISFGRTGLLGNNAQLTWPSVIGLPYQVQYSSDLAQWFVLTNFIAPATTASVIDPTPIPSFPRRFYRLR